MFDTRFAKVGVYICYDRHFPEGARLLGLGGAEIVFNPSATVAGLSEHRWKLEQPAHAVANGYYLGAINRVGFDALEHGRILRPVASGGSARVFVVQASRDKDEVIVGAMDRNVIREVRNTWQFYRDRRPETYGAMVDVNDHLPCTAIRSFSTIRPPHARAATASSGTKTSGPVRSPNTTGPVRSSQPCGSACACARRRIPRQRHDRDGDGLARSGADDLHRQRRGADSNITVSHAGTRFGIPYPVFCSGCGSACAARMCRRSRAQSSAPAGSGSIPGSAAWHSMRSSAGSFGGWNGL